MIWITIIIVVLIGFKHLTIQDSERLLLIYHYIHGRISTRAAFVNIIANWITYFYNRTNGVCYWRILLAIQFEYPSLIKFLNLAWPYQLKIFQDDQFKPTFIFLLIFRIIMEINKLQPIYLTLFTMLVVRSAMIVNLLFLLYQYHSKIYYLF